MSKPVRMSDIAEKIGVSTVTVSKALGDKDGVSEEMRAHIKEMAIEMGYKSQGVALPKKVGVDNIGVIIPERFLSKNGSFYWEMYQRVITRLLANNYYGMLEVLEPENENNLVLPKLLQSGKANGIVVLGQLKKDYLAYLHTLDKVPAMFLDSYEATSGRDSVISDGYYGMYAMTNYLLDMGHTDIYFVGTINSTSSISDRYFGYCRAMSEKGINVLPHMVIQDREKDGKVNLKLPQKLPTAFACNCDYTAYELIGLLKQKGINVPEDVSVIGFDDYFNVPVMPEPALTTYAVDMDGMTRACVDRLIRKINNKNYAPNLKVVSGHIVVRDSVKDLTN